MLSEQHTKNHQVNFMSKNMYVQSISILGSLHRFFLNHIQIFLEECQHCDLNATQALIVYHIGKNMFKVNEIVKYHFYEGSNPSYNLKKMLSAKYLKTSSSQHDRRVLLVALSDKGVQLHQAMDQFFQKQEQNLEQKGFSSERWQNWVDEGKNLVKLHNQSHSDPQAPLDNATRSGHSSPRLPRAAQG